MTKEHKQKIKEHHLSLGNKHWAHRPEVKAKLVKTLRRDNWTGKKRPDVSKFMTGRKRPEITGENASTWKGGYSGRRDRWLKKKENKAGRNRPEQCEVCGAIGRICFDHNHKTGEFRGWICLRCNSVLGFVKDNGELLIALNNYLKVK